MKRGRKKSAGAALKEDSTWQQFSYRCSAVFIPSQNHPLFANRRLFLCATLLSLSVLFSPRALSLPLSRRLTGKFRRQIVRSLIRRRRVVYTPPPTFSARGVVFLLPTSSLSSTMHILSLYSSGISFFILVNFFCTKKSMNHERGSFDRC